MSVTEWHTARAGIFEFNCGINAPYAVGKLTRTTRHRPFQFTNWALYCACLAPTQPQPHLVDRAPSNKVQPSVAQWFMQILIIIPFKDGCTRTLLGSCIGFQAYLSQHTIRHDKGKKNSRLPVTYLIIVSQYEMRLWCKHMTINHDSDETCQLD